MAKNGVAIDLSTDHKPENPGERSRIVKAGSTITEGRVDGNLNLSRSLGDLKYKKAKHLKWNEHPITAYPDIKKQKISPDTDFIIMGCDGMYETKTSQEIVDFVYKAMKEKPKAKYSQIIADLMEDILSPDYVATGKYSGFIFSGSWV
jgi:serine/threonine protein phosphatase PrpC